MIPGARPTKGSLLVATPPLEDPNFDRTVIYVLEHHREGAVGVVLNRPTDEPLDEPLDRWDDLQAAPRSVFSGGPVETDALIALARSTTELTDETDELAPVSGVVASADLTAASLWSSGRPLPRSCSSNARCNARLCLRLR